MTFYIEFPLFPVISDINLHLGSYLHKSDWQEP